MRGAKDEERVMNPLFPRLHVNDTEKGGRRPPPRNKMALYEQLSIPSQRFSSGSASILHLPSGNGSSLVPSMSSSHVRGCGYERNGFARFSNSVAPSCLSDKVFPSSSDAAKLSTVVPSKNQESMNTKNDQSLRIPQPLLTAAKHNLSLPQDFSDFNIMLQKEPEDENEVEVPSSAQSGTIVIYSTSRCNKHQENRPKLNLCFSMPIQNVSERQKRTYTIFPKENDQNQSQENADGFQTSPDSSERSTSVPSAKGKTSVDASSSPAGKATGAELLNRARPSPDQDYPDISTGILKISHGTDAQLNQVCVKRNDKTVPRGKEDASKTTSESYMKPSLEDNCPGHENGTEYREDVKSRQLQVEHVKRIDNSSETSMESILALNITPDDVVGVIGEKQFWKARRAIVNQQRVFAIQVFELHRLIRVQKSIAGSPHLLHQDDIYVGQCSLKVSPVQKLQSEYGTEQPCLILKQPTVQSQKLHPSTKLADENAVRKAPHATINNEDSKGLPAPHSNHGYHSGSAPPVALPTNAKPIPWCFPLPGNQWLVPVMSASEGLVYKPYTGPCPPTAGFMAPVYGGSAPMSISAGSGDFSDYGLPASHQDGIGMVSSTPLGQNCFLAYGFPFMNPSVSGSSIEQISPFCRVHSKDNELSTGNINLLFPHQSSFSMPSQVSRVICAGKYQASKGSDKQGGTGSSPSEKAKGNELPLFPTEPTVLTSDQYAQTNRQYAGVIKVVPHNPRSAMESAARIFQSIQEERNSMTNL